MDATQNHRFTTIGRLVGESISAKKANAKKPSRSARTLFRVTTDHGRQLRGAPSIGYSLPHGVSTQTAIITLSSASRGHN